MDFKYTYTGNLADYHETGMECLALILEDDRASYQAPSFNNKTKKYDGPMQTFKTLDWTYWFGKQPFHLTVWDKKGKELFNGIMTYNRKGMTETKYALSYVSNEVDYKTLLSWVREEYRAKVMTNEPIGDDKKNSNVKD